MLVLLTATGCPAWRHEPPVYQAQHQRDVREGYRVAVSVEEFYAPVVAVAVRSGENNLTAQPWGC